MTEGPFISDTLKRKVIFFTGKGGVGKSSIAYATALAAQRRGMRVRLVSWNPYDEQIPTLSTKFAVPRDVLETQACFKEYVLRVLKFESLYNRVFDNYVLKTFLRAAPGLSETVLAGKIWDLYFHREQDLLLVDLPASGHALSFFRSPLGVKKIFPVGLVNREIEKVISMFTAPEVRIDLVTLPEPLPVTECLELKSGIENLMAFHFGFLHINQVEPSFAVEFAEMAKASVEARNALQVHQSRVDLQTEAMTEARAARLPTITFPRLVASSKDDLISQLVEKMETV